MNVICIEKCSIVKFVLKAEKSTLNPSDYKLPIVKKLNLTILNIQNFIKKVCFCIFRFTRFGTVKKACPYMIFRLLKRT